MTKLQEIKADVLQILGEHDLHPNEEFIKDVIDRVDNDADPECWNIDDVRIAIRNALNEMWE